MYLVIDTSTHNGAVGLWRGDGLARTTAWSTRNNHTAELMPAVQGLLDAEHAAPADLTGVIAAHGPGGFSALRAGLAVAKGLAFAVSAPLAGVSTLEATAYAFRGAGLPVCPLISAGRDLVAWARFQQTDEGWVRRAPDRVTLVGRLLAARGRHALFCGEGAHDYAEELRAGDGRAGPHRRAGRSRAADRGAGGSWRRPARQRRRRRRCVAPAALPAGPRHRPACVAAAMTAARRARHGANAPCGQRGWALPSSRVTSCGVIGYGNRHDDAPAYPAID